MYFARSKRSKTVVVCTVGTWGQTEYVGFSRAVFETLPTDTRLATSICDALVLRGHTRSSHVAKQLYECLTDTFFLKMEPEPVNIRRSTQQTLGLHSGLIVA